MQQETPGATSMHVHSSVLCFLLVVGVHADSGVEESNEYMDNLLSETFPRFSGIFDEAPLIDFKIKLNRRPLISGPELLIRESMDRSANSIAPARPVRLLNTGRILAMTDSGRSFASHWDVKRSVGPSEDFVENDDLEMQLKHSRITSFDKMKRLGDCSPPMPQSGNVTLSCFLTLDGVKAHYLGYIKEEYAVTDITATLKNSTAFIEVTSFPGGQPTLVAWVVSPFGLEMSYSRNINIAAGLRARLLSEIQRRIKTYVTMFLNKELRKGFANAVKFDPLPPL
ncbi:uncharacterized protein LOC135398181 isoform X2 [Ornithodoros turicata]|uniref:uncharacterized protein LOC135398181 isoform X2 n=1 Tax=Ornithodoros turicata TaxID=34597 RepID=UPI003138BDBD